MSDEIGSARETPGILRLVGPVTKPGDTPSRDLDQERKLLWGICYRMTGSAADAEDLVQETFMRAIERPPADQVSDLRPWLVRVAMNLARDLLRKRRRLGYPGVWLPQPIELEEKPADGLSDESSPESRYGMLESASFAFLFALEALTPSQRAVLILRDAFDYSSQEAGKALAMSEENVRITLHRARKAMASYDRDRAVPSASRDAVQRTLVRLLACLSTNDLDGARALFAEDARALSDGGGVHPAARGTVKGPNRIVKMYGKLRTRASADAMVEIKNVNGAPAAVGKDPHAKRPNAPRFVMFIDLDRRGKIRTLFSVLAPEKLARIFPEISHA